MKKQHRFIVLLFITAAVAGCGEQNLHYRDKPGMGYLFKKTKKEGTKYGIRSGIITFQTAMKTFSVDYEYKTIVYFDDYGIRERRDTYRGDTLTETLMSDGERTYRIMHAQRRAYWSGKARQGTEPRFGWDKLTEDDFESGKVERLPDERIAGKTCLVYAVRSGQVYAKYAGWKDIILLSEIKSEGGYISTRAVKVQARKVPASTFQIPEGYMVE